MTGSPASRTCSTSSSSRASVGAGSSGDASPRSSRSSRRRRSSARPCRPRVSIEARDLRAAAGSSVEHPLGGLRLEHRHGKAVRDQVVQLARDPCPLVRHGRASGLLPVTLEQSRAGLECLGLAVTPPEPAAEPPHARDHEPSRQDLVERGAVLEPGEVDREHARTHGGHADGGGARVGVPAEGVDREQDREPGLPAVPVEPVVGERRPDDDQRYRQRPATGGEERQRVRRREYGVQPGLRVVGAPDLHLDGDEEEQHEQHEGRARRSRPVHAQKVGPPASVHIPLEADARCRPKGRRRGPGRSLASETPLETDRRSHHEHHREGHHRRGPADRPRGRRARLGAPR